MRRKDKQNELLFQFLQKEGPDVIHLPYTPAFENVCSALSQEPSIEDKHKVWERILELQSRSQVEQTPAVPTAEPLEPSVNLISPIPNTARMPPPKATSGFRNSLFEDESVRAEQPWTARAESILSPELQQERERMLADVAESRLGATEQRVAYLLQRFPETRESDIALCIRYWRRFQADVLEKWRPLELEVLFELDKLETIGRIRRHIQHTLHLFRGMEETTQYRDFFQKELHEYLASHRGAMPEVRFYLDETGNEGDKAYTGVAGLCIINWQQYEKHHAALAQWRREQNWPETIHFSETGSDRIDRAVGLLGELTKRRSGLLFLGYALGSRGRTHEDLFSLFIQLVIDSLNHLKRNGSLDEPRSLRVMKEADPGFDNLFLIKMHKQLSDLIAMEFPGQIIVQPIEAVTKGREVFLECADLIAGGMQRRALMKGHNPKDKLAEAVFNVTGFEDATDDGAVFKFYPSHP
jgi:hypothetical protein